MTTKRKKVSAWSDWRWQLRHALTDIDEVFCAVYGLNLPATRTVQARYPVFLTPYALSQLTPSAPADPINLQMLPHPDELKAEPGIGPDPFAESGRAARCRGLKQRFPDRVLLMASARCAMNCRHCTRKNLLGSAETVNSLEQLAAAVDWVRQHPKVREVLISGGDPLLLSDRKLIETVKAFAALPQIDAVRIGTRTLSTLPMRITPTLAAALGRFRKVWVNTQFNHPREITPEAASACALLADAGIPVSNQSVLLKGVNDSADTMFELCAKLQRNRVRPYYVFVCDPVAGIAPFRVPASRARQIERELAARLGGLAMPRFVADLPGARYKTPVSEYAHSPAQ
ncbi:MAG: KamA family radical SAM protein [Kiritimatiellae bacterium]|nr:KamA family radical SAM protein [Kiritimatiellia bacterium]